MSFHLLSRRSCWLLSTTTSLRHQSTRSIVQHQYQLLVPALQNFQRLHGHVAVPIRFNVPSGQHPDSQQWPQELHGLKLGANISRFVKAFASVKRPSRRRVLADIQAQLRAIGLPDVDDWKRFLWEEVTISAMKTYRSMHGDLLMPVMFKVPTGHDAWPQATWGYKLGYWTSELRRSKDKLLAYQLRDLEALDFSWSAGEALWNRYFLPAMQRYRELHGSSQVPQSFVVPCDDPKWPAELGGYRLGQKVNNLRCGNALDTTSDVDMWQEVELICKNWMMLETLHEVDGSGVLHDEEVDEQLND